MHLPPGANGLGPPIGRWLWRQAIERPGYADTPRLVLRIASPPNQAREPWLEWLHLEVANVGLARARKTRAAVNVLAQARVSGIQRSWALMWSNAGPNGQPARRVKIHRNFDQGLPLELRSAVDATIFRTRVAANLCYLTDENLLTQGLAECPLEVGDHFIEVTVQHGDAEVLPTVRYRARRPRARHSPQGDPAGAGRDIVNQPCPGPTPAQAFLEPAARARGFWAAQAVGKARGEAIVAEARMAHAERAPAKDHQSRP